MTVGPSHYFNHPVVRSAYNHTLVARGKFVLTLFAGSLLLVAIVSDLLAGWIIHRVSLRLLVEFPILTLCSILWWVALKKHYRFAQVVAQYWEMYRMGLFGHIFAC